MVLLVCLTPFGCEKPAEVNREKPTVSSESTELEGASGDRGGNRSSESPPSESDRAKLDDIVAEARAIGSFSHDHVLALKSLVKSRPSWGQAGETYQKALETRRDWEALIDFYQDGDRLLSNPENRRSLAVAMIEASRLDEAVAELTAMAEAKPGDAEVGWLLARAEYERGHYEASLNVLASSWDRLLASGNVDAIFLKAAAAFQLQQLDVAEEALQFALSAAPGHAAANDLMGRVQFARERPQDAAQYLKRAKEARDAFNEAERSMLRRLAVWQTMEDACRSGAVGGKTCESAIRQALDQFDDEQTRSVLTERLRRLESGAPDGAP